MTFCHRDCCTSAHIFIPSVAINLLHCPIIFIFAYSLFICDKRFCRWIICMDVVRWHLNHCVIFAFKDCVRSRWPEPYVVSSTNQLAITPRSISLLFFFVFLYVQLLLWFSISNSVAPYHPLSLHFISLCQLHRHCHFMRHWNGGMDLCT